MATQTATEIASPVKVEDPMPGLPATTRETTQVATPGDADGPSNNFFGEGLTFSVSAFVGLVLIYFWRRRAARKAESKQEYR